MITTSGAPGARIAGLGYYRPARVVENEAIAERVGVDPQWIEARTGIRRRRVAAAGETVVDMATEAAQKALAASSVPVEEVDAVVVATSTAESTMPSAAPQVADRLGLSHPAAFDVNVACAGFCVALACADSMVRSGTARSVLVVGADRSSSWLDRDDRTTAILFGDGAGAAVVTASAQPAIGPVVWGSVGEGADLIAIDPVDRVIRMEGQPVFRWATGLAPIARRACEVAGVDPAELAAFVPHQANVRIIDALVRGLGLGDTTVARDVVDSGNTIAASVPLALALLVERGDIPPGRPVLLFGFGAGLVYAGQVVTL